MRDIPQQAIDLITSFEGFSPKVYFCSAGKATIGYGHKLRSGDGFNHDSTITRDDAKTLLMEDLVKFAATIESLVEVPLNDNEFAALISFVYNVGAYAFSTSTLLKLLNRGWFESVPAQFTRWNKVNGEALGGLARRRAAESLLWVKHEELPLDS